MPGVEHRQHKGLNNRAENSHQPARRPAAAAATVILDGVKSHRWRILVVEDARRIDDLVRHSPDRAYDVELRNRSRLAHSLTCSAIARPSEFR